MVKLANRPSLAATEQVALYLANGTKTWLIYYFASGRSQVCQSAGGTCTPAALPFTASFADGAVTYDFAAADFELTDRVIVTAHTFNSAVRSSTIDMLLPHQYDLVPPKHVDYDKTAPLGHALAGVAHAGGKTTLSYTTSDDSGKTRERITVYAGKRKLWSTSTTLAAAVAGTRSVTWSTPRSVRAPLRFCVEVFDATGNSSVVSWAKLTLR
jgi:hypothetical protein